MNGIYHKDSLIFCNARECLEFILFYHKYNYVYIPYYICGDLIHVFSSQGVRFTYYHINSLLEPSYYPELAENEAFLYINYFGLKQDCVLKLFSFYDSRLIVDNAQAFFSPPIKGVDTFYSSRKFYGVKNGAFLYLGNLHGINDSVYKYKKANDSLLSKSIEILKTIDYDRTIKKRLYNYMKYENALHGTNQLCVSLIESTAPMVFPYYPIDNTVKKRLRLNGYLVEQFWPYVFSICSPNDFEYNFAAGMIPLFIGQDCSEAYINNIINLIVT